MKKIILLTAVSLFAASSAMAADGAALFKSKMCGACHGAGKKGGDLAGCKLDKGAIVKYMKDPKAANPKATMMPIKGSDEELNAIADYVVSLKK